MSPNWSRRWKHFVLYARVAKCSPKFRIFWMGTRVDVIVSVLKFWSSICCFWRSTCLHKVKTGSLYYYMSQWSFERLNWNAAIPALDDRRIKIRKIIERMNMFKSIPHHILRQDLGARKLYYAFAHCGTKQIWPLILAIRRQVPIACSREKACIKCRDHYGHCVWDLDKSFLEKATKIYKRTIGMVAHIFGDNISNDSGKYLHQAFN